MAYSIYLKPGIPDDDNRDYLPLELKDSEIVVNENGNNSQPYPKKLQEFRGDVVGDGLEDVWYEYVPDSYDPAKPAPLVFSMHGGLMTGWGQCVYTSWTHIADREGFLVVYPTAHTRGFWQIMCEAELKQELTAPNEGGIFINDFPDDIRENHDANLVLGLIERMKARYNIDEGRIYMQGMSAGNAMTQMMSRFYADRFAAMAGSAGPARRTLLFDKEGKPTHASVPVDVWQTRMELDGVPPACSDDPLDIVALNRDYWLEINGCVDVPQIAIHGEDNLAFYKGEKADYVFRDVKNRDHGQTFDDAEFVWDFLFSGARRGENGEMVHTGTKAEWCSDAYALGAVAGCPNAWVNGKIMPVGGTPFLWKKLKYHGIPGDPLVRGEYLMLPVEFLAKFAGAVYEAPEEGVAVIEFPDGRTMQFARGCIAVCDRNLVRSMLCEAVEREGRLYVSGEWFFRYALGMNASRCADGLYATDHYAELSIHMTRLLRDLLK